MSFLAFFFFFYQSTALSSRAVDGHQMYSGGSVVGRASTIDIEISPTSLIVFTWGQKVWNFFQRLCIFGLYGAIQMLLLLLLLNLALFSTSLNFEPPAFKNAAKYRNSETNFSCSNDRPMSSPSLVKLGPRSHAPWEPLGKLPNPLKLHGENVLNRQ